ncbi:hypothetical protein HPB48_022814 [Haemaphysalis longicornis]|uniref:Uncharacterized protein n=1 Tax=Haemaphysalis longicornis TaxID=44386 RepID=A0A9J6FV20_HAELO|nr:hypothetical protein HPB48_022814 [Haemaphysalis longicornis]
MSLCSRSPSRSPNGEDVDGAGGIVHRPEDSPDCCAIRGVWASNLEAVFHGIPESYGHRAMAHAVGTEFPGVAVRPQHPELEPPLYQYSRLRNNAYQRGPMLLGGYGSLPPLYRPNWQFNFKFHLLREEWHSTARELRHPVRHARPGLIFSAVDDRLCTQGQRQMARLHKRLRLWLLAPRPEAPNAPRPEAPTVRTLTELAALSTDPRPTLTAALFAMCGPPTSRQCSTESREPHGHTNRAHEMDTEFPGVSVRPDHPELESPLYQRSRLRSNTNQRSPTLLDVAQKLWFIYACKRTSDNKPSHRKKPHIGYDGTTVLSPPWTPESTVLRDDARVNWHAVHQEAIKASFSPSRSPNGEDVDGAGGMEHRPEANPDCCAIRDVWASNLEAVFRGIRESYGHRAMAHAVDTEFPGVAVRPQHPELEPPLYQYSRLRSNAYQRGPTLLDGNASCPPLHCPTWQFNFKFHLLTDEWTNNRIRLLARSGIQFDKHEQGVVDSTWFPKPFVTPGVLTGNLRWLLVFTSGCDFGYLINLLKRQFVQCALLYVLPEECKLLDLLLYLRQIYREGLSNF